MKGVIYRIYDNTNGNIYYGSTIQNLSNRIGSHRATYKRWLKGDKKVSCKSFEIIKNGDYDYNIVEEIEYETKYELHNRERYYIENNDCVNKLIPNRTYKEYYEDSKEYYKKYREDNKNKINQYYKDNKNKILERQKEYNKKYKEDNKNKINQYYENNKNEILEKCKEKITCDCGCNVRRGGLARHKKSKKHNDLLNKTL